jgi:DNA replication protein DnaC
VAIAKDSEANGYQHRKKLLRDFLNPALLILDDFVYDGVPTEVGKFIFRIVNERHEMNRSIIFTSNVHFSKWSSSLFGNEMRKNAAIDLLEGVTSFSASG